MQCTFLDNTVAGNSLKHEHTTVALKTRKGPSRAPSAFFGKVLLALDN